MPRGTGAAAIREESGSEPTDGGIDDPTERPPGRGVPGPAGTLNLDPGTQTTGMALVGEGETVESDTGEGSRSATVLITSGNERQWHHITGHM